MAGGPGGFRPPPPPYSNNGGNTGPPPRNDGPADTRGPNPFSQGLGFDPARQSRPVRESRITNTRVELPAVAYALDQGVSSILLNPSFALIVFFVFFFCLGGLRFFNVWCSMKESAVAIQLWKVGL